MNYFVFNGESSSDYGIYIGGQGTFDAPQRDVEKISIPGRNGDLVRDKGKFLNITVSYPIVIMNEFKEKASAINEWLKSSVGYHRLEDTYHPEYYRMAMVTQGIKYSPKSLNRLGTTSIDFDCKPQKWLKSGEETLNFTSQGTITNPTRFESNPLITIFGQGSGTLTIGNQTINLDSLNEYVVIDSELMDCYKGNQNRNSYVRLNGEYPKLGHGETGIRFSGGVTRVEVKGRWYIV